MNISELSNEINNLSRAWNEFKQKNDERLNRLENNKNIDPLTEKQLAKINKSLDLHQKRVCELEAALNRPASNLNELKDDQEEKSAFYNYIKKGISYTKSSLSNLSANKDEEGGYLVRPQFMHNLIKELESKSSLRKLASQQTISTNVLEIIDNYKKAEAGWASETQFRETTNSPKFEKRNIYVNEMYAQPKATQKLLEDSVIDIEQWMIEKLSEIFGELENKAFLYGDGNNKPRGILSYKDGKEWENIEQIKNKELNAESLFKLYYSLSSDYISNACFLMHRTTIQQIRMLKDPTSGRYLWSPSIANESPNTLLGMPLIEDSNMPEFTSKDLPIIAFGDFRKGYQIVDRKNITIMRDPFTEKPFVKFYTRKRVGGDIKNFFAIKLFKKQD